MPNPPPDDLQLRDAAPGNELGVARVHVRTWQEAYRGLLPADYLASLRAEDRAGRYTFADMRPGSPRTIVAVADGAIVGFATVRVEDAAAGLGELAALYVDPPHWNRGFGAALILAARERLVLLGCRTARLWLLEHNRRGERFYRLDGWEPDGERRQDRVWGVDVVECGFRRRLE